MLRRKDFFFLCKSLVHRYQDSSLIGLQTCSAWQDSVGQIFESLFPIVSISPLTAHLWSDSAHYSCSYLHLSLKACLSLSPSFVFLCKVSGAEDIVLISAVLYLKPSAAAFPLLPIWGWVLWNLLWSPSPSARLPKVSILSLVLKPVSYFPPSWDGCSPTVLGLFPGDSSCKCMVVIYHLPSPVFICKVWIFMLWLS